MNKIDAKILNIIQKDAVILLFNVSVFSVGAFSRFPFYLFGKEAAKKDATSIGASCIFFIK